MVLGGADGVTMSTWTKIVMTICYRHLQVSTLWPLNSMVTHCFTKNLVL